MTVVFNVGADGSVQSTPAYIPQGVSVDVVVVSPFYGLCTFKVMPPNQIYAEDAFLTPVFQRGDDVVWKGRLPKSTANTAGKAVYQIQFDDREGRPEATYSGSFTVQRGAITLMPGSVEELGKMTIDDIYRLLSEVTAITTDIASDLATQLIIHDTWTSSVGTVTLFPNTTNIVKNLGGVEIAVSETAAEEEYWSAVVYVYIPAESDVAIIRLPPDIPIAGDDISTAAAGDIWEIHINNIGGAICHKVGG